MSVNVVAGGLLLMLAGLVLMSLWSWRLKLLGLTLFSAAAIPALAYALMRSI